MVQIPPPSSVDEDAIGSLKTRPTRTLLLFRQRTVSQLRPGVSDLLDTHWLRVFDIERQTHFDDQIASLRRRFHLTELRNRRFMVFNYS
jgi:hypothetical protein